MGRWGRESPWHRGEGRAHLGVGELEDSGEVEAEGGFMEDSQPSLMRELCIGGNDLVWRVHYHI